MADHIHPHSLIVDGDLYLKADPRREPPQSDDPSKYETFKADIVAAMLAANEANSDAQVSPEIANCAADWVWFRLISLRPTQLDALIALQEKEDRFDASALSILTGIPVSKIKSEHRRIKKGLDDAKAKEPVVEPTPEPTAPTAPVAQPVIEQPAPVAEPAPVAQPAVEQPAPVAQPAAEQPAPMPGNVEILPPVVPGTGV